MNDHTNRRTSHRAKVDLLINRFLDGHPYMCRMVDISASGLKLEALLEPKGAPRFIGLQFQLPGEAALVMASGEIVSNETENAGHDITRPQRTSTRVRFTRLAPECASAIRRFVDTNA